MELTDEQLSNVSGGGSGNIPDGGITYNTYTTAYVKRYYSKTSGSTDLIYIGTDVSDWAHYYTEILTVDTANNTWSTQRTGELPGQPEHFYTAYPYMLNIK